MAMIASVWSELLGLFVDDGRLALHATVVVAAVALAVRYSLLSPLAGGFVLLAGCLAILAASLRRKLRP